MSPECNHWKCRALRNMPAFLAACLAITGAADLLAGRWLQGGTSWLVAAYLYVHTREGNRLRKAAFDMGWVTGRHAMVDSLWEAQRRGMDPNEWLRAEVERDAARLGAPPPNWGDNE